MNALIFFLGCHRFKLFSLFKNLNRIYLDCPAARKVAFTGDTWSNKNMILAPGYGALVKLSNKYSYTPVAKTKLEI